MRSGLEYVHERCLDIAMLVHKVQYNGPKYIKVKATLFNRHNGILYEKKTYIIYKKELPKWKLLSGSALFHNSNQLNNNSDESTAG